MGPPDTQKTGDAVGEGGALSPTAHKLLFIQLQMEGGCPRQSQFPSRMRKHDVTELPKRCFNVQCMSSAVQVTERGREGGREKRDTSVKRQRPVSVMPLAPYLATAGPYPAPLIPVKPRSRNQRTSNQVFSQHYTISDTHIKCTLQTVAWISEEILLWSPPPTGQNGNSLRPWEVPFWLNIWEISQRTNTLNQYDIASANEILLTSNILWITD